MLALVSSMKDILIAGTWSVTAEMSAGVSRRPNRVPVLQGACTRLTRETPRRPRRALDTDESSMLAGVVTAPWPLLAWIFEGRIRRACWSASVCTMCILGFIATTPAHAKTFHAYEPPPIREIPEGPGVEHSGRLENVRAVTVSEGHLWVGDDPTREGNKHTRFDEFSATTGEFELQLPEPSPSPDRTRTGGDRDRPRGWSDTALCRRARCGGRRWRCSTPPRERFWESGTVRKHRAKRSAELPMVWPSTIQRTLCLTPMSPTCTSRIAPSTLWMSSRPWRTAQKNISGS